MVTSVAHISGDIIFLHEWFEYSCVEVQGDVQKVDYFCVGLNGDFESISFKYLADFFLYQFNLPRCGHTDSQAVVAVEISNK